jgi:hypothetical protein
VLRSSDAQGDYDMKTEYDATEPIRRNRLAEINCAVESLDTAIERARLRTQYGQVWDTTQFALEFEVIGFAAPYVVVKRKLDGLKGSLEFQHAPRFYFNFVLDRR